MAMIIDFPPQEIPPCLRCIANNLYLLQIDDTPEAQAAADKFVIELRKRNYLVPDYMKV